MICPFCGNNNDKVIDSRPTESDRVIRRRRECLSCSKRFSTYERVEVSSRLMVIKRDGTRVPFDPEKVLAGIAAACGKRPISEQAKKEIVDDVEESLTAESEPEVPSSVIGERVMTHLRVIDDVAYIRFASEHLGIASLEDLKTELDDLMNRPPEARNQQDLFKKK